MKVQEFLGHVIVNSIAYNFFFHTPSGISNWKNIYAQVSILRITINIGKFVSL